MERTNEPTNDEWQTLAPLVDALVGQLRQGDREAILLRFYRQMSHAEVGASLGINEEAARKRVDRAVERLRELAIKRGVVVPTAAFAVVLLAALTSSPAPAGVIAIAATGAFNATIARENVATLVKTGSTMSKTSIIVAAAGVACVAAAGLVALSRAASPATKSFATTAATTNPDYGGSIEIQKQAGRMKVVGQVLWHSIKNEKQPRYPHTFGELLGVAKRVSTPGTPPATLAAYFVLPQDAIAIPAEPTAAWIDAHTHLVYLAADADRRVFEQANQVDTVIFHTRLETPYHEPGVGDVILASFADGRTNTLPIAEARAQIAASVKTLAAARAAK